MFLYLDHLLGYAFRIRPWLRAGDDVVMERGWWDLPVDPHRYRLRATPRLIRALGRSLPAPEFTLVLSGDADRAPNIDVCRPVEEVGMQAQ